MFAARLFAAAAALSVASAAIAANLVGVYNVQGTCTLISIDPNDGSNKTLGVVTKVCDKVRLR